MADGGALWRRRDFALFWSAQTVSVAGDAFSLVAIPFLVYHQTHGPTGALYVSANNIPYQAARSLDLMHQQKAFYFYPYRHVAKASLGNVLIIGSGTGNDAAVALSEGARHVDTVEIDPLLVRLGNMHPNHPYSSPRLTAHVDDGRAFLQTPRSTTT